MNSKCPRDYKGPSNQVRLKIKVDEYEMMSNKKTRANRLTAGLKNKNNPKEDTLKAMMGNLEGRQEDFDDEFFESLGGGESLKHVKGGEDIRAAFQNPGAMVVDGKGGGKRKDLGGLEEPPPKAKKLKDADSKRNNLRNILTDKIIEAEDLAKDVLQGEAQMLGILSNEEKAMSDFGPMLYTLKVRIAALKMLTTESPNLPELFHELGFRGTEAGQKTAEQLQQMTPVNAIESLCTCLDNAKRGYPMVDFQKCTTKAELLSPLLSGPDKIPCI